MSQEKLFTPLKVGAVTAPNRVFMAPLTRLRSIVPGAIPTPLMTAASPFSCGIPGVSHITACSQTAKRRLRLLR